MRGNHRGFRNPFRREGSIPARAGNRRKEVVYRWPVWSIPARAGEPHADRLDLPRTAVYPRPCGGTVMLWHEKKKEWGLSPPVRGNPEREFWRYMGRGSIPARAGEPSLGACVCQLVGVYPRPCGGTLSELPTTSSGYGLSPPVRGNRGSAVPLLIRHGSIPARAGEPRPELPGANRRRVYPRPCGGTAGYSAAAGCWRGLSPPVRGNLPAIPQPPAAGGVYPRPCGGTETTNPGQHYPKGLSPPVRGNLHRIIRWNRKLRSIPARAGEPERSFRNEPLQ